MEKITVYKDKNGNERRKVQLICEDKSLAQQQFKDECDINTIMNKYIQKGILPDNLKTVQGMYGDFSNLEGFQEAMQIVQNAQYAFESLDMKTRERFKHNPEEFVAFCSNPANQEEIYKMGLAERPPKEEKPIENQEKTTSK